MEAARANWTLKVQSFGKIRSAEIKFAPLLIFVGKNNTGKSYLASLMWAILNSSEQILRTGGRHTQFGKDSPVWFGDALEANTEEGDAKIEIKASRFASWYNSLLSKRKADMLSRLLAWKGVHAESIRISFPRSASLSITRTPYIGDISDNQGGATFGTSKGPDGLEQFVFSAGGNMANLQHHIANSLACSILNPKLRYFGDHQATYIPAARTGFMLALNQIISGLFDGLQASDDSGRPSSLPLPLVRFLRLIIAPPTDELRPTSSIADFLESSIIGGRVKRVDTTVPSFEYIPKNHKKSIPLRASSSMITELAPFLFLLRNADLSAGVVFEEPEAHLHISAQRCMARAIARLVNLGIPVVLTTHSDTFLQQLNLLMSLHSGDHKLTEKYGYESEDVINPSDARAYEFVTEDDMTDVRSAKLTKFGFVIPTINEVLEEIVEESLELQA